MGHWARRMAVTPRPSWGCGGWLTPTLGGWLTQWSDSASGWPIPSSLSIFSWRFYYFLIIWFPDFLVSWFPWGFLVCWFSGFLVFCWSLSSFPLGLFLGYVISWLFRLLVSWFPEVLVSGCRSFLFSCFLISQCQSWFPFCWSFRNCFFWCSLGVWFLDTLVWWFSSCLFVCLFFLWFLSYCLFWFLVSVFFACGWLVAGFSFPFGHFLVDCFRGIL